MKNYQAIYQQANPLPPLEKLQLVELLLADLDTPNPEIDAVWREEAQRRWQAYRAGELKTVSYDAVMQKYK
ncbi:MULTISPECIES: addiction module protein [Methylomicrobium]|uniref:Putative addiction module component, TIGR02574 family n=1 Tax=Methylomicrobium album BG8 TaxID=686340 RepID=H8GPG3_METAL|nr:MULTISPECIES: addiction module protein [Methylomicrobium]EIC30909.1 putative addiction module component, TIGR02574 family [Methylomicrobium album BG8]